MTNYTTNYLQFSEVFTNTSIIGYEWIIGVVITIITMLLITRNKGS